MDGPSATHPYASTDADDGFVSLRWSRHPRCVGLARAELQKVLADWGLVAVQDSALLVLSELLTNAVRHAHASPGREIETRYVRERGGVRIEVHDAAEAWPKLRRAELDASGGRGLALVAVLAGGWGVSGRGGIGKVVWAVLTAPEGDYVMADE
nr:ATP-binding protein [Streptomyces pathocidini]